MVGNRFANANSAIRRPRLSSSVVCSTMTTSTRWRRLMERSLAGAGPGGILCKLLPSRHGKWLLQRWRGQRTDIAGCLKRGLDRVLRSAASRFWVQLPTISLRLPYGLLKGNNHAKGPGREQRRRNHADHDQPSGTPQRNLRRDGAAAAKSVSGFRALRHTEGCGADR